MMRHYMFSTPIPPSSSKQNKKNQTQGMISHQSHLSSSDDPEIRMNATPGNTRSVTCYNASSPGGSAISKSPDEERCVVAGKDCMSIYTCRHSQ